MEALLEKRRGGLNKLLSNLRLAKSQWGLLFVPPAFAKQKRGLEEVRRASKFFPLSRKALDTEHSANRVRLKKPASMLLQNLRANTVRRSSEEITSFNIRWSSINQDYHLVLFGTAFLYSAMNIPLVYIP